MDIKAIKDKLLDLIKKYKYPVVIFVIGILLMTIPTKQVNSQNQPSEPVVSQGKMDVAQELEQILTQIRGVGKVSVMLTQAAGESYLYQYDEDVQIDGSGSSSRKDTVIITDSNRNQSPVISQILPPKYLGAIIVCQGAEDPSVKLAVVAAVSRITGLGADMICVLKMK